MIFFDVTLFFLGSILNFCNMSLQEVTVSFFYNLPAWGGPLNMKKYKLFPATSKKRHKVAKKDRFQRS